MNVKAIAGHLDAVLKLLGFARQKNTWNRKVETYIDVLDIQTSKSDDTITINGGILHPNAYKACWGNKLPPFIQEPFCTVRARLGHLIDGNDAWWSVSQNNLSDVLIRHINVHMLPFFERMHSVKTMEEFLSKSEFKKGKYPPDIIYLAILKRDNGKPTEARRLLEELYKNTVGAWQPKVSQAIECLSNEPTGQP